MSELMWEPSEDLKSKSAMAIFMKEAGYESYQKLHEYSVKQPGSFWTSLFDFFNSGQSHFLTAFSYLFHKFIPHEQIIDKIIGYNYTVVKRSFSIL